MSRSPPIASVLPPDPPSACVAGYLRAVRRLRHGTVVSLAAVICCVLFTGCGRPKPVAPASEGLRAVVALISRYGAIDEPAIQQYLDGVADRVRGADLRCAASAARAQITLLNTSKLLAASAGGGMVVVSRGLIAQLEGESQLAFVLAHEIAHQALGHLDLDPRERSSGSEEALELELAADRLALACIVRAGYDPRPAIATLPRLVRHADHLRLATKDLPAGSGAEALIEIRSKALITMLHESDWRPPGTFDRRDFQILRRRLILWEH